MCSLYLYGREGRGSDAPSESHKAMIRNGALSVQARDTIRPSKNPLSRPETRLGIPATLSSQSQWDFMRRQDQQITIVTGNKGSSQCAGWEIRFYSRLYLKSTTA